MYVFHLHDTINILDDALDIKTTVVTVRDSKSCNFLNIEKVILVSILIWQKHVCYYKPCHKCALLFVSFPHNVVRLPSFSK